MIDLRSDTVTRPTPGMRRAMYEAEVGDDVFGEDPTVNRLQERVAELLGKEAALFVPSGVMGNQLAIKVHTQPGDEVLVESGSHIFNYESGAPGLLSGVLLHPLAGERGVLTPEQVTAAVRPAHYVQPPTRLLCLENTHNRAGGAVYPPDTLRAAADAARARGLAVHLDGARLWHAAVACGVPEADLAAPFDTVSVCLSKGLGAPVGSVLAGPGALIERAHRFRKMFGGGMRQAGILAAAGLYALDHHRSDLSDDHRKARRLAEGLSDVPGFSVAVESVETNIVMIAVPPGRPAEIVATLRSAGVLMLPFGDATIRAITHRDVSMAAIDRAVNLVRQHISTTISA